MFNLKHFGLIIKMRRIFPLWTLLLCGKETFANQKKRPDYKGDV